MKNNWDFSDWDNFIKKLLDFSTFENEMLECAKNITKELRKIVIKNTPVATGRLVSGWKDEYIIKRYKSGFEIEFRNYVNYAASVNYGHPSYNQYNVGGSPYLVKRRIKVTTPNSLQNPKSAYWVWGRFFVEESIILFNSSDELEKIVMRYLKKWWGKIINGK